jgi:4-hydroxymandelate oxidase
VNRGSEGRRPGVSSATHVHVAGRAEDLPAQWPVNLLEFEELARSRLTPTAYDYIAGGADAETTVRENCEAFQHLRLLPRVLVDVSRIVTEVEVLGEKISFPVLIAPTAFHQLAHPEGEAATARAAAAAGTIMVVSTIANLSVTEVAAASDARLWFQLYIHRDRGLTRELIQRAEGAGCRALCLTVDSPAFGRRDRDMRNAFRLPEGLVMGNLRGATLDEAEHGISGLLAYSRQLDPSLDWNAVEWLRSTTPLPVVLKGILDPRDAREAVRRGAAAIIVSNHGGRQLDGAPATLDALPGVVEAVGGSVPVLMDGGVRRGTDVLKALALGAWAVLVGRPILWGLAAGGQSGVERVLALLRAELEHAMRLSGRPDVSRIDAGLVCPAPRGSWPPASGAVAKGGEASGFRPGGEVPDPPGGPEC